MSWLPDSLQLAFAAAGDTLADLVLCSGSASLRVETDSSFTTVDSVGTSRVVVLRVGNHAIQCAAVRPGATRLFHEGSNGTNAVTIRMVATAADTCGFVLLHRGQGGDLIKLQYAPFPTDSGGSATLAISRDSTV